MASTPSGQHGSSPAQPPGSETSLDDLPTEAGGEPRAAYDLLETRDLVDRMRESNDAVLPAVAAASAEIAAAIDAISGRLSLGGRLIYVGAGSSGRIAAVDAAECASTFSTPSDLVVALVAGGVNAPPLVQEASEDDDGAGAADVTALAVGPDDAVVGVSASGRTPYVLGALGAARDVGALCAAVVSVRGSALAALSDHEIAVVVGPEFLAGSTRLNAGTAQKLVLNMISTISMIRLGKTYGNLMVDVFATNDKLHARVRRIVLAATEATPEEVEAALAASDGEAKVAIVSILAGVDADEARARLSAAGDNTRVALTS
jgi:N-acetylmuramic acid 6-phosphate etherase